jgi:peptide/nickel transport system permease protein
MRVREEVYVEAVRALGAGHGRIAIRHILPNALPPIIVQVTLSMATAILSASYLGFLGLGAQPPSPEWGAMLNDGRRYLRAAMHVSIFPGLVIMVTILAFNLFGDGLRDALDPKSHRG